MAHPPSGDRERVGDSVRTRRQLDRLMKRYGAAAGIPEHKRHMHCLKHSVATHLFDRDEPVHLVQDHLGHADIRSTMVHAKVTPRKRDELAERLARPLPKAA